MSLKNLLAIVTKRSKTWLLTGLIAIFFVIMAVSPTLAAIGSLYNPFGFHGAGGDIPSAKSAGSNFLRFVVNWQMLEPTKGNYDFKKADNGVKSGQNNNQELIVSLTDVSNWGGSLDAQNMTPVGVPYKYRGYPRDPQAWVTMVGGLVERYDGDGVNDMAGLTRPIKYYQVDEEWLWMWIDSPQSYIDFLSLTSNAIKAADPNAKVVSGAFTGLSLHAFADGYITDRSMIDYGTSDATRQWVTQAQLQANGYLLKLEQEVDYFAQNACGMFDFVDIHSYTTDPYVIEGENAWLRDKFTNAGCPGVRFVSFENGGPAFDYTTAEHSSQVVTRFILGFDAGYERMAWSSLMPIAGWSDKYSRLAMESSNKTKYPSYYTYKLLTYELKNFSSLERIEDLDPSVYIYKAMVSGKPVFIMWKRSGTGTAVIPFSTSQATLIHIITVQGQTYPDLETLTTVDGNLTVNISSEPVFVQQK